MHVFSRLPGYYYHFPLDIRLQYIFTVCEKNFLIKNTSKDQQIWYAVIFGWKGSSNSKKKVHF